MPYQPVLKKKNPGPPAPYLLRKLDPNVSLQVLVERTGLDRSALSRIFSLKRNPQEDTRRKIATALGITVEKLDQVLQQD